MAESGAKKGFADYVTVAERIEKFYERYPEGRIISHIIDHDAERGFILMRAEVYRNADDALPTATGHAYELKTEGYVQRTSYIEVCETSSVGRALAMAGFEVKRGIASREEAEKAERMGHAPQLRSPASPDVQCETTGRLPAGHTESQVENGGAWAVSDAIKSEIIEIEQAAINRTGLTLASFRQFAFDKWGCGVERCTASQLNMYKAYLKGAK